MNFLFLTLLLHAVTCSMTEIVFFKESLRESNLHRMILSDSQLVNFHLRHRLPILGDYDTIFSPLHWIHKNYSKLLLQRNDSKFGGLEINALKILLRVVEKRAREIVQRLEELVEGADTYGVNVMRRLQSKLLQPAPLLPFNRKLARQHLSHSIPLEHHLLLIHFQNVGLISSEFIEVCRTSYQEAYKQLIRTEGEGNRVLFPLRALDTPKWVLENVALFSRITSSWLRVWLLAMRIFKPLLETPIISMNHENFNHLLVEGFKQQTDELEQGKWKDVVELEYSVEFSCLFIDYLIACMRFALKFDVLGVEEHSVCLDQIQRHRQITDKIIRELVQ